MQSMGGGNQKQETYSKVTTAETDELLSAAEVNSDEAVPDL